MTCKSHCNSWPDCCFLLLLKQVQTTRPLYSSCTSCVQLTSVLLCTAAYCCVLLCTAADLLVNEYQTSPQLAGMSMPELQNHMSHLRHLTFKRLTEQMPNRKSAAGAGNAGAANTAAAAAAGAGTSAGSPGFGGSVELGHITAGATGSSAAAGRNSRNRDAAQPFDQSNFSTLPL